MLFSRQSKGVCLEIKFLHQNWVTGLYGKLYGDKGYVSNLLSGKIFYQDVEFITNVIRNMKPRAITLWDKIMLRKCFIIETVNDELKNITQIEHTRHRSPNGFMLNLIGFLIAYCHKKDKHNEQNNYRVIAGEYKTIYETEHDVLNYYDWGVNIPFWKTVKQRNKWLEFVIHSTGSKIEMP